MASSKTMTPKYRQQVVKRMYERDGRSLRAIAAELHLSPTRVHQIAVDAGVKRRAVGSGR